MKTIAVIQARMGSSRLPNKVLMPVLDKPLLGWMLDRVSLCKKIDKIVVATTTEIQDDVIEQYATELGVEVYRGSEHDVLDRYYQASKLHNCDAVLRLTSDCPLLDPRVIEQMIDKFGEQELDFLSNSEPLPSSWPDGMDVSIMSYSALERAWRESKKPSEREHVTFYFWDNPDQFKCARIDHEPDLSSYRLTIDYLEDFELLREILEYFGSNGSEHAATPSMKEIIEFLNSKPGLLELNQCYKRGMGWEASFSKDREQGYID